MRAVEGVAVVAPVVMMLFDDTVSGMTMGVPPMITGGEPGADEGRESFVVDHAQGRALTPADEGRDVAVLGTDMARKYGKDVGDAIELKGDLFEVVGLLAPTLTAPDQAAMIPLAAAQRLFYETLPPVVAERLAASDLVSSRSMRSTTPARRSSS